LFGVVAHVGGTLTFSLLIVWLVGQRTVGS